MVYTVKPKALMGDLATIISHDEKGHEASALHFHAVDPSDANFPCSVEKVAQNLASLLNGNAPLYALDSDLQVFWTLQERGIMLRTRSVDQDGISTASLILHTKEDAVLKQLHNPDFMKELCSTIAVPATKTAPEPQHQKITSSRHPVSPL